MVKTASQPDPRRMRPTDVLKREHRQIEARLDVLSAALRALGDRGPDPAVLDRIEKEAHFIDEEMAIHHRKEEEGLFPVLGPYLDDRLHLDGRVADHEDLRIMSGKFKDALEACRQPTEGAGNFDAQMLRGYGLYIIHLVLEHLLKEDEILFLVADRYLTQDEEAEVLRRFRAIAAAVQ